MLKHMRTTVNINDALMRRLKQESAKQNVTMGELITRALQQLLSGSKSPGGTYRLKWRTEKGSVMPGVVLTDRDSLFEIMDGRR